MSGDVLCACPSRPSTTTLGARVVGDSSEIQRITLLLETPMPDAAADKPNAERLMADLQAVVRDTEVLLRDTAGFAGDKAQEVRARAEGTLRNARVRLAGMEDEVIAQAKEMTEAADKYVRNNPWQAVGVAAGVGLLVGLLVGRRS